MGRWLPVSQPPIWGLLAPQIQASHLGRIPPLSPDGLPHTQVPHPLSGQVDPGAPWRVAGWARVAGAAPPHTKGLGQKAEGERVKLR